MSYKKQLDDMIWSFSRIKTYDTCPYQFYLRYIEGKSGEQNFWAENGKAVHSTLENYFKEQIDLDDMPEFYIDEYEGISSFAKEETMDKVFNDCLDFFCEFDFSWFDDYEVLGVEKSFVVDVFGYKIRGFIDLLLREKKTGDIVVFDHKSSSYPFKKDGKSVLKNSIDQFESYKKQMYIYSKYVIDEYKVQPKKIMWLHFKDQKIAEIDFNIDDYNQSLAWAKTTIDSIYHDERFESNSNFIMCNRLCEFRHDCEYKEQET